MGVLLSLKSVTQRIGMASLPKKPASLLSPLLSFCSVHKLTLYFFPFFFSFFLWTTRAFQCGGISAKSLPESAAARLFLSPQAAFPFASLHMQMCINAGLSQQPGPPGARCTSAACTDAPIDRCEQRRLEPSRLRASQRTSSHTALKTAAPFFPLNPSRILDPPHPDVRSVQTRLQAGSCYLGVHACVHART